MNRSIKKIAVSAILIALASVLSMIKIAQMPLGGSLTLLSMLPIILIPVLFGTPWGFFSAFVYSLIQLALGVANLMTWGMDYRMWIGAIVFDYILAYTVFGFAGIFRKKGYTFYIDSPTNQIFVILENEVMERLRENVSFSFWERLDDHRTVVRFATGWATTEEDLNALEAYL